MQDLFLALKGFLLLGEKLGFLAARLEFELFTCHISFFPYCTVFLDGMLTISDVSLKTEGLHLECQLQHSNENKGSDLHIIEFSGFFPLLLQKIIERLCM